MEFFYKSIHQRLAAVHRLYSERKRVTDMSMIADIICTGTGDRIWRICDQLSLFKKETGAPAVSAVPVTHIQVAVAAAAPVIVPAAPAEWNAW